MSSSYQRRKRKRKRTRKQRALARVRGGTRIALSVPVLELARGHDGLLRGAPEPALVVGVYRVDGEKMRLCGRFLYRFSRPDGFPTKVGPREPSDESMVEPLDPQTRLLVLALAVEEDSGRGLATLFAQLESSDTMMAWTYATDVPVPTAVPELAAGDQLAPDLGHRIHIMMGDRDPSVRLDGDDWIDANLVWTQAARARRRYRLHFVSADERNDWTAELELWLRRA